MELSDLKRDAQLVLANLLDKIPGKKDIVLESALTTSFNIVFGFHFLREHGADKIFRLEQNIPPSISTNSRVFLCAPTLTNVKLLADQINKDVHSMETKPEYHAVFVPQVDPLCELLLEEEGVYGYVKISCLPMQLVPIDDDLLSFELRHFFRDVFISQDDTQLAWVAHSLAQLQELFGDFSRIQGVGTVCQTVVDILGRIRPTKPQTAQESPFSSVVLFDRSVDLVSPLCSQLIYSGLVDEIFGFNAGLVEFGVDITGQEGAKIQLSGQDEVYAMIRDLNFSQVAPILSAKLRSLGSSYDERHNATSIHEIKEFVGKLGGLKTLHKSLKTHISAAERIMEEKNTEDLTTQLETEQNLVFCDQLDVSIEWIEECMHRQAPYLKVLRLLCLASLTNGGLKPDLHAKLKQQFLQSYGYEHLITMRNLEEAKLFYPIDRSQKGKYAKLKQALEVGIPTTNEEQGSETDLCVYYGYAPLSVLVIDGLLEGIPGKDLSKFLPVFCHDIVPSTEPDDRPILVYFVGGVTLSELASLRCLGKLRGKKFAVATTNILNGDRVVDAAVEVF